MAATMIYYTLERGLLKLAARAAPPSVRAPTGNLRSRRSIVVASKQLRLVDAGSREAMLAFVQHQHNVECCCRHQRHQHARIGLLEGERVPLELATGRNVAFCNTIMTCASAAGLSAALALESLDQLFERKILVGEGREGRRANPTHHLLGTGVAAEIGAEDHRIRQRADQPLGPRAIAIGDERRHAQVLLTQVAMQQRLQGGDERHEQRAAFAMAETLAASDRRAGNASSRRAVRKIVDGPSRTGRGEFHHGQRIAQLLAPVFKLRDDVGM